ncbi:MAG: gamma-glutamylcyclotransferase family protein [Leptolyngbyaceae cyanobacterium bins.302]|nr:gamma-glutamylcyclotransferase family protein [Leptolyngbyaceae cyanobacterium bins.302]
MSASANLNVFVYGTLKPGEVNYRICAPYVVAAQAAIVTGRVYHLPFGYPAMTIEEEGVVHGVLLSFASSEILAILDEFEQHDPATFEQLAPEQSLNENQYHRVLLKPFTPKQSPLGVAWGYVMNRQQIRCLQGQIVPGGRWSKNQQQL